MKNYIYIFLLITFSCRKNNDHPIVPVEIAPTEKTISVTDIVNNSIGTYTCTRICKNGNILSGYVYDTTYNTPLLIEKENDSTLSIERYKLFFSGNVETKYYHFYQPSSGGGHHANIDSTFNNIFFSYWNGGLGGGSGCTYYGHKL